MGFILISPKPLSVPGDGNEAVASSRDPSKSPVSLPEAVREESFSCGKQRGGGLCGWQEVGSDLFTPAPLPSKELARHPKKPNSNACPELKRLHHPLCMPGRMGSSADGPRMVPAAAHLAMKGLGKETAALPE